MKFTLTAILWDHKMSQDGKCPVVIRIAGGGKKTYYNTGIKIFPDNWLDGLVLKGQANYDIYNKKITGLISDVEREIEIKQLGEKLTLHDVKAMFSPEGGGTPFMPYAKLVVDGKKDFLLKTKKGESTIRRYNFEYNKLLAYNPNLKFSDITHQWLDRYYKHLIKEVEHNTAINAFKVIRHVFNLAKKEKVTKLYPFHDWDYPQYTKPQKEWLNLDECNRIFEILDSKTGPNVKIVAAFFLLECFAGVRFSDWNNFSLNVTVDNQDMLLTTFKTGTPVAIPIDIMPSLYRIVSYIRENNLRFPANKDVSFANEVLREYVAPAAEITKYLTTHVARHTFATMWLSKGISKTSIAKMMGITEKQVETYAHFDNSQIRNEVNRVGGI